MRILTVLFIFLAIIASSFFMFSCTTSPLVRGLTSVREIDGCEYVLYDQGGIVHKANCKNH